MEYEHKGVPLFDPDISWLRYCERILQEAGNESHPLIERLRFLGRFDGQLHRVRAERIPLLRKLLRKAGEMEGKEDPLLRRQFDTLDRVIRPLQEEFDEVFWEGVLSELGVKGVQLHRFNDPWNEQRKPFLVRYFRNEMEKDVTIEWFRDKTPSIQREALYLFLRIGSGEGMQDCLIRVPRERHSRFVRMEDGSSGMNVFLLEDVVRVGLTLLFPGADLSWCFPVKFEGGRELNRVEEFSGSIAERGEELLGQRTLQTPFRVIHDADMPWPMVESLLSWFDIRGEDAISKEAPLFFQDFEAFPDPGDPELAFDPMPPLRYTPFRQTGIRKAVEQRDHLLFFPYYEPEEKVRFVREAAVEGGVRAIKTTLELVAEHPQLIDALKKGVDYGKGIGVVDGGVPWPDVEERSRTIAALEEVGVHVLYPSGGQKWGVGVCLIERKENGENQALLTTGGPLEKKHFPSSNMALFTADQGIVREVASVFAAFEGSGAPTGDRKEGDEHLMVGPNRLPSGLDALIDREMAHARRGNSAAMVCKMNSLQDPDMIAKLYRASNAGVQIRLLVRDVCCLIPERPGWSENIEVRSPVGRFSEDIRLFLFFNNGDETMIGATGDWSTQDLYHRANIAFPIDDPDPFADAKKMIEWQWEDPIKTRRVDERQTNRFIRWNEGDPVTDAQFRFYQYLWEQQKTVPGSVI